MSQCLRNNWVTRGRDTVHFTAQTPLRMPKTLPDVLLEQPETSWRLLSLHWTLLINRATKVVADMLQAITNHQADFNIMVQPFNKECSKDVARSTTPLVSLVSAGSLFDDNNALCDIDDLSMKTR